MELSLYTGARENDSGINYLTPQPLLAIINAGTLQTVHFYSRGYMNQIDKIHYDVLDADLRVIVKQDDQSIWFVASDIAKVLEYRDAPTMVRCLDEEECDTHNVCSTSDSVKSRKSQEMTIISESGLYQVILNAKTERVKPFKHWVTHEVLPHIRKTGSYGVATKTQDKLSEEQNFQEAVKFSFDLAEKLGKHFSNGVLQASLLESDQRIYDRTAVHFLPEIARDEARKALPNYTFDRSVDTAFAHTLPVADFLALTVTEIASKFDDKDITTKVINNWLIDGGYQKHLVRGFYTKTELSKDIATERKIATGDHKGRNVIVGWVYNTELAKYLDTCYKQFIALRDNTDDNQ